MANRTVSVALCSCNGEKYIADQLQSIVDQTLLPTEIIVCDDASEDRTIDIVDIFVQKYSTIHWVIKHNTKRLGVRQNFEQAIKLTTSEYIATSDQDDIWNLQKLERLMAMIQEKNVALIHSGFIYIDKKGEKINVNIDIPSDMSLNTYILRDNNVTGCTCLFKATLKKILFPLPRFFYFHDRWLAIMAYNNGGIYFCNEPLTYYRQHESNVVAYLGGGGKKKITIDNLTNKADDLLLVIKKRRSIKYSKYMHVVLLKQYVSCLTGFAWIKMISKSIWR